ncbi:MAG: hypothetical protein ACI37P_04475, partial [Eggerthellaceae bacterium]
MKKRDQPNGWSRLFVFEVRSSFEQTAHLAMFKRGSARGRLRLLCLLLTGVDGGLDTQHLGDAIG